MLLRTLIIFLIPFISFSQKEIKDYYLQKTLRQDNLQYQFSVLDDDKTGVWIFDKSKVYFWYKSQKVHNTQGGASGELLHGVFSSFYNSKQLHSQGKFFRGLKTGRWNYWRENGKFTKIESWLKGRLLSVKIFSEDGMLKKELKYKGSTDISSKKDSVIVINSSKQKRIEKTFEDNKLVKQESFKGGVLHGDQLIYSEGKLVSKKKFKMGEEVPQKEKREKKEKAEKEPKEKKKAQNNKANKKEPKQKRAKKENNKKSSKKDSTKKPKKKKREKSKSKD